MEEKELDKEEKSNTIVYTVSWNATKSSRLKRIRGASFEQIFEGELLDIRENPGRQDQQMLIFNYRGYIWAVPSIIEGQNIFLKTLYRSRKYQKMYKKGAGR
ncbi:toxin [Candidatus Omnitrophota bacterium]